MAEIRVLARTVSIVTSIVPPIISFLYLAFGLIFLNEWQKLLADGHKVLLVFKGKFYVSLSFARKVINEC